SPSIMSLFFLLLPLVQADQSWTVNENHHHSTKYGDMILSPSQLSRYESLSSSSSTLPPIRGGAVIIENSFNRWPNNTIPFTISSKYSTQNRRFIRSSLSSLQSISCFTFVHRSSENDFIDISPLDGCYSFVGRVGGRQPVSLSLDCLADYIIWHEILHVLGFEHEHQRPDRDEFIRVEYSNVLPGQMVNFEKLRPNTVELNEPYDYRSIMHYDGNAFGRFDTRNGRRLATMTPLKKGIILADNLSFSETDLRKLRSLGRCDEIRPSPLSLCRDLSSLCGKVASRGFCKDPAYFHLLKDDCKKSCGWCQLNDPVVKAVSCEDTVGLSPLPSLFSSLSSPIVLLWLHLASAPIISIEITRRNALNLVDSARTNGSHYQY
ncbi:hypothetical protein PMAYCL1PPCAC_18346, partial [Pristionchus mayeri]